MSRYWSAELLPAPLNKDPGFKQLEIALDLLLADADAYAARLAGAGGLTLMTPYVLTDGTVEFLSATDPVPAGAIVGVATESGGSVLVLAPSTTSVDALIVAENASGSLVFA